MQDKFIVVNNKKEADKAACYLESLGYTLTDCYEGRKYDKYTKLLSTAQNRYYFSDLLKEEHEESFNEEEIFIPNDFMAEDAYVLSGVWQYYDGDWVVGSPVDDRDTYIRNSYRTRDLYIKVEQPY